MQDRWMINKIGLVNFWYYDEEEFDFSNGKLLLRGSNGSGKSVTMQSFIPLLLDGNKSPERLDPFGSRARKLETYLLGEEDMGEDERTGYLYMEFVKPSTEHCLTVGIGLRARRGKSVDFWGFSITDGRKIGKEFFLYKEMGEKVPLSKIELRNRIAEGGEYHESQRDYMAMVNKLLFGFENPDDYDELIKLLIQIRTPKLSKEFKPTVIYGIMNNALQPLSDEDLRPMSEAIENMDNIKSQLEILKDSQKAAERLKNEYDRYNQHMIFEKANALIDAKKKLDHSVKEMQTQEKAMQEYKIGHQQAQQNCEELKSRQKVLEHKKQELEQHDSFKAKQEMDKRGRTLKELSVRKEEKEQSLAKKKSRERILQGELTDLEAKHDQLQSQIQNVLSQMSEQADAFYFHEHDFAQDDILKELSKEYNFMYLKNELERYRQKIVAAKKALQEERAQSQAYDDILKQRDMAKEEKEKAAKALEIAQGLLDEVKEEVVEKTYAWHKQNKILKLTDEALVNVTRLIKGYGQHVGFDDIISEVRIQVSAFQGNYLKEAADIEAIKSRLEEQRSEKQEEVTAWKNKKDPEPERVEKVILNRERMRRAGIPFVPLYKAVDFQDDISMERRGQIEEALADMGLLDALIVPGAYKKQVLTMDKGAADKYIFSNPQYLSHELSKVLKPEKVDDAHITYEDIDDALKSIMLHDQESLTYINEKGEFGIGILKGHVSGAYLSKFIGTKARERYRKEVIEKLEAEIQKISDQIDEKTQLISAVKQKNEILNQEFHTFPSKDDIETAFDGVKDAKLTLENKIGIVSQKEEEAEKRYKNLKQIREKVREITLKIDIALHLEAYEKATEDFDTYKDMLRDLETNHKVFVQMVDRINGMNEQIEEILQDIDNLLYDINGIKREIDENEKIILNYQEMLRQTDYEEIRKEIEACIEGLNTIPEQIEQEIKNRERCNERYQSVARTLAELKQSIEMNQQAYKIFREGFKEEYKLGYFMRFETENDLNDIAMKVCEQLKNTQDATKTRENYVTALMEKLHENRQYLTEYHLTAEYIFDAEDKDREISQSMDQGTRKAQHMQKRLEIRAKIKGRDVNFYTLVEALLDAIEENEKLLRESDRQLFEDILANTISKKIRAKIYHAEQWVKKMNALMEGMNTSSGLSFSLMWKSKVAETEEQLDTKKLVDILKSEASLLKEEDFQKLSSHFRSKIAQARKRIEDTGSAQTFHTIMKEILDYRKWFEFQLFFQKTGMRKKELTNNAFDVFSGGEKAMAMYVPLFSAVYARYEGARKDCPRMISLDEAFAGVDENNIRDMFKLLEELKLNFIVNSQILWGDYDTVPSLSICELIRPNNANVVSVIRYQWDGKVRTLVS